MSKFLRTVALTLVPALATLPFAFAGDPKPPGIIKSEGSSVRVVAQIENTKFVGWKLYAIRPNSYPAKVGLMNGDLITAIDAVAVVNDEAGQKRIVAIVGDGKEGGILTVTRRGAETKVTVTVDKK